MKKISLFILICSISFLLKTEVTVKAITPKEKDLNCITLLELAGKKSKESEETVKYEKLKKLQKSLKIKYVDNGFSEKETQEQIDVHVTKIKEKGQRYINKGLQKCGLK